jgi:exopolysaccharide biosynthesis polyprenyl glycosylphosphotransferase
LKKDSRGEDGMFKERKVFFRKIGILVDLFLTILAFYLAFFLIQESFSTPPFNSSLIQKGSILLLLILLIWFLFFYFEKGLYGFRSISLFKTAKKLIPTFLKAFSVLLASVLLARFSAGIRVFSLFESDHRFMTFLFLFGGVNFFLCLGFRKALPSFLRYVGRKGNDLKRILVVGMGKPALDFVREIKIHPEWGYQIIGILDWERKRFRQRYLSVPVISGLDGLPRMIKNRQIDGLVFATSKKILGMIQPISSVGEKIGVPIHSLADFFPLSRCKEERIQPLVSCHFVHRKGFCILIKSLIDRMSALVGIIMVSPIFLLISVLIKVTSEGSVFFKQKRVGLNGERFYMYKFRTMVKNADKMKKLLQDKNEMDGPVFKIKDDPRMTSVGRILRKFSLDELPQLFNVLLGDMSLVGPRPPLPEEVSQYELWQRRRLSVKPGITCLWQVNGRNNIDFQDWMKLDLEYIDNWSLWLDIKILAKTLPAVILAKGAR